MGLFASLIPEFASPIKSNAFKTLFSFPVHHVKSREERRERRIFQAGTHFLYLDAVKTSGLEPTRGSPLQNPHRQVPLQALKKSSPHTLAANSPPDDMDCYPRYPLWPQDPTPSLTRPTTISATTETLKDISTMNIGHY